MHDTYTHLTPMVLSCYCSENKILNKISTHVPVPLLCFVLFCCFFHFIFVTIPIKCNWTQFSIQLSSAQHFQSAILNCIARTLYTRGTTWKWPQKRVRTIQKKKSSSIIMHFHCSTQPNCRSIRLNFKYLLIYSTDVWV